MIESIRPTPAFAQMSPGGTPNLHLSPGTLVGTTPGGTNLYDYDFGLVASATQTFTVTNDGNGTTNQLILAGCCSPEFALANNTCDGQALAPAGMCTFDLSFTAPAGCSTGEPFNTPLDILGPPAHYIHLEAHGSCP